MDFMLSEEPEPNGWVAETGKNARMGHCETGTLGRQGLPNIAL
jgi:hypothetical protein